MRDIYVNNISMKNFFSVGETPLELDFTQGLNLITGINADQPTEKNGIGKSTICEGVMFALFGSVMKDITKNEIVNDVYKKKCEVSIQFSVNDGSDVIHYTVTRGIAPSFCTLTEVKNGVSRDSELSIPKTNEKIELILGVSKYVFTQTLVMSIGKSKPFFGYSKPERRKYIEGIFNIDIFSTMNKIVGKECKDMLETRSSCNSKYEQHMNMLQSYTFKRDNFIHERDAIIDTLRTNITKYEVSISEISKNIPDLIVDDIETELVDVVNTIASHNSTLKKIRSVLTQKSSERESAKFSINALTYSDVCQSCGRPFDESHRTEHDNIFKTHTSRVETLSGEIDHIKSLESKAEKLIETLDISKTLLYNRKIERNDVASKRQQILNNISILDGNIADGNKLIDDHMNRSNDFDDLIVNTTLDIEAVKREIDEIGKSIKSLEICKMLLSDEGVKINIIQKFRSFLNTTVNKYLAKMTAPVKCSFDEYFDCTLYNVNNTAKSYDAFSSGEQKRIDLAMLFTFQDILRVQNGINIHLSFYDEILDTSLCDSGRDAVLNIIKERSQYSAEYIISHKQKSLSIIDREIKLEKRCGFTHLKEIVHES